MGTERVGTDMHTGSGDAANPLVTLWQELANFATLGMAERWRWEAEREAGG